MTYDPRREDLLHQSAKSATTTDKDWRRAYAESDGDHRSYVERYAKPDSPDPRDAVIAELCEALENIARDAALPATLYAKNGPTWTGKDGHEYEDMSTHLGFAEEIEATALAALRRARGSA